MLPSLAAITHRFQVQLLTATTPLPTGVLLTHKVLIFGKFPRGEK